MKERYTVTNAGSQKVEALNKQPGGQKTANVTTGKDLRSRAGTKK